MNGNHTSISISTSTMVRGMLVLMGVVVLWILRDLLLILITSIVVASFMESSVPYLRKVGLGRVFGIFSLYAISISTLAGLFYLFAPLLITEIYNFSTALSDYVPGVYFLNYFQNDAFSGAKDLLDTLSNNLSFSDLNNVSKAFIQNLSGGFFQTISVAFGSLFNFSLIILISFYLSIQERGIENFLRVILPIQHEDYVVDLWERSRKKIALWVKGQLMLALVEAVLIYLMLSLLGIQYALVLAIIAGIMAMVPYGIVVALVPAIAFSYFSGGIPSAAMVTVAYLIVHQFEVFLFAPIIIKKVVGLSPIVIILAVLVGFELGDVWGAVVAIPMAVVLVELSNDIEKKKLGLRAQRNEE